MKKICVDIRMAFHSGIGTYIRNIIPHLKHSGLSLQVLAPSQFTAKWPELNNFDLIPFNAPIYSIREQIELPLKIPSCDLFWSTHYNIPLVPVRAKHRLVSMHDVYHLAYNDSLTFLKRRYAKVMLSQAASRSDHVVTISNYSKNEIIKWTKINEKKISVTHLGVNRDQFYLVKDIEAIQQVKNLYVLPENYMLYVGNLSVHKNLSRLLEAWKLVLVKHKHYKLILVGKNDRQNLYKSTILQDPQLKSSVVLLGNVQQDHLPTIYQLATGFIFPSLYEGFGLPPLEAMKMECPTIVSNAASLPEVCQDASLFVDPYDVNDISQKICELIENPILRQTLINKGSEHIKHFSWEKAAQTHLEIIQRLMA